MTITMTVTLIITRAPKPPPTVTAILLSSDAALNQNNDKIKLWYFLLCNIPLLVDTSMGVL